MGVCVLGSVHALTAPFQSGDAVSAFARVIAINIHCKHVAIKYNKPSMYWNLESVLSSQFQISMNMISINNVDMRKLDEHNQRMRWAKM